MVEAVEVELRKNNKFGNRFRKALNKSFESGTLIVLDERTLPGFVSADPRAIYDAIQTMEGF
jgi:hypothetical protein